MIKTYLMVVFTVLLVVFINKRINTTNDIDNVEIITPEGSTKNNEVNVDRPITTTISQKLSEIMDYIPKKVNEVIDNKPVVIVRNKGNYEPKKPIDGTLKKDFISPNPIDSTEYRFIGENPKSAWSDQQVSHHPSFYKADFKNELTQSGKFFDEDKNFHDITSPKSQNHLPDRCKFDDNKKVVCEFNNKLHNIPPKLIQDKNNQVIKNIGGSIISDNVEVINNNSYQVWGYEEDKKEEVTGASKSSGYLELDNINPNYSI